MSRALGGSVEAEAIGSVAGDVQRSREENSSKFVSSQTMSLNLVFSQAVPINLNDNGGSSCRSGCS
jgi:hypothetical protein